MSHRKDGVTFGTVARSGVRYHNSGSVFGSINKTSLIC